MTLKELRHRIAELDQSFDHCEVVVWLPGSRIDVVGFMGIREGEFQLEGNVRVGSVLEDG